jgi:hypothetical protein
MPQAPPPAVAICNTDVDCDTGEICDQSGIPACVPTDSVDTVLEVTFDNGTSNQAWTSGGWSGNPLAYSEHSTGGNPDGFLEYIFPGAPILWLLGNNSQFFWLLPAPASLDTIDFSIDVKVIEAGAGVIGGEVAAVVTNNDGTSYMGPFDPVRTDTTTVGWQTISRNGLTANNFCRVDFSTGNQDCSDHPDFSCPYGPNFYCLTGGFFIRSEESSSAPISLGFDNWRMTFRVTP